MPLSSTASVTSAATIRASPGAISSRNDAQPLLLKADTLLNRMLAGTEDNGSSVEGEGSTFAFELPRADAA